MIGFKSISVLSQINIDPADLDVPQTATADSSTVTTLLQYAFVIGAIAAMFVIILAGIQFITSQGEPEKASSARRAVIYAIIGLIICISSFTIVRLVLSRL